MFVQTQIAQLEMLNYVISEMIGVSMSFPTVHLFSNNFQPTNTSVLTDFTEADFTGYAAVQLTSWTVQAWQSQGAAVTYSNPANFRPSGTTVLQTVYGYYVTVGSGPTYLGAENIGAFPFPTVATELNVVVAWGLQDGGVSAITY